MPVGIVVLEGAPRDLRAGFRKWDDGTGSMHQGRKEGDRVVGLSAALEALAL